MIRSVWTADDITFQGRHFTANGITAHPRPVTQPHPPIWIGASGEKRMMPIAARYADVWHCFGPVDVLGPKSQRLSEMAVAAGREPGEILRSASLSLDDDLDDVARTIEAWDAAGFEYLVCGWPGAGRARVEEFATRFLS